MLFLYIHVYGTTALKLEDLPHADSKLVPLKIAVRFCKITQEIEVVSLWNIKNLCASTMVVRKVVSNCLCKLFTTFLIGF